MNDWTAYGRIDADGTVYVKTAGGERVVGSWQAGTAEEGLAHFARRFDGVVTEVNLIETRLATGAGDAAHALNRIKELRAELDEHRVRPVTMPGETHCAMAAPPETSGGVGKTRMVT